MLKGRRERNGVLGTGLSSWELGVELTAFETWVNGQAGLL